MKKSPLLGAVLFSHVALLACGEEAPQLLGDGTGMVQPTDGSDGPVQGIAPTTPQFSPSPPPGTPPPAVSPGTPPITPGEATITPGGPAPGDTTRPTPPMPPTGTATATPPTPTAPATDTPVAPATTTPVTPTAAPTTPVTTPTGSGNALVPDDTGWVAATTNGAGVQGAWYDYMDSGGTTSAFTVTAGTPCISGTTAALVTDGVEWGAGMGLVLNDGGEGISNAWDGAAFTGFSFDVELTMSQAGAPATVELVMATTDATATPPHEKALTAGANTVTWTTALQPSWAPTMVALSASLLTKIQFKVGTTSVGANDFTLCISNLTVM